MPGDTFAARFERLSEILNLTAFFFQVFDVRTGICVYQNEAARKYYAPIFKANGGSPGQGGAVSDTNLTVRHVYDTIEAEASDIQQESVSVEELISYLRTLSDTAVAQKRSFHTASLLSLRRGVGGSGKRWHYWSVVDLVDPVLRSDSILIIQNNCTQMVDLNDDLAHFKEKEDDKLATFSHELRTPLNGIINLAESLGQRPEFQQNSTVQRSIKAILDCGKSLARNIEAAMEFSAAEQGDLERDSINLVDVVANVLEICRDKKDDRVSFVNNVADFRGLVYGSSGHLERILVQLIENACKFTDFGSITVSARERSGGDFVEVSVTDTGCGINADQMRRIFGQFEQADMSATRRFGGLGLGLSLCKKLVEEGGGDIDVVSSVGKGSCFRFTVPTSARALEAVQTIMKGRGVPSATVSTASSRGSSRPPHGKSPKRSNGSKPSEDHGRSTDQTRSDHDESSSGTGTRASDGNRPFDRDTDPEGEEKVGVSSSVAAAGVSQTDDEVSAPGAQELRHLQKKLSNLSPSSLSSATSSPVLPQTVQNNTMMQVAAGSAAPMAAVGSDSGGNNEHTLEEAMKKLARLQAENEHIRQELVVKNQEARKLREQMAKAEAEAASLQGQLTKHKATLLHRYTEKGHARPDVDALPSNKDVHGSIEVLSVDDNPINQMVIKNILTPAGYTVTTCADGIECLDVLEKRDVLPDLLLLDIMMPQISGYEVCFRLREMFPTSALPIIMVSAKTRESCIVDGFKAGANDYVTKPYKRTELLARVDTQLRLKEVWRTEIEAEKTDDMLRQVLPAHMLSRLKSGELIADAHNNLTVLVADIHHTTSHLTHKSPLEAMRYLEQVMEEFKKLCTKYNAYKVETIGSSLMAVMGHELNLDASPRSRATPASRSPVAGFRLDSFPTKLHDSADPTVVVGTREDGAAVCSSPARDAHRMYALAQEFIEFIQQLNTAEATQVDEGAINDQQPSPPRALDGVCSPSPQSDRNHSESLAAVVARVGIHAGPGYSGIVPDQKMPSYAFFGTTVRTATRIAHGGFPMTVHVSEAFVNSMGPDRKTDFVVYAKQYFGGSTWQTTFLGRCGDFSSAIIFKHEEAKKTVAESSPEILSDEIPLHSSPIVRKLGESFKRALLRTYKRAGISDSEPFTRGDSNEDNASTSDVLAHLVEDFINDVRAEGYGSEVAPTSSTGVSPIGGATHDHSGDSFGAMHCLAPILSITEDSETGLETEQGGHAVGAHLAGKSKTCVVLKGSSLDYSASPEQGSPSTSPSRRGTRSGFSPVLQNAIEAPSKKSLGLGQTASAGQIDEPEVARTSEGGPVEKGPMLDTLKVSGVGVGLGSSSSSDSPDSTHHGRPRKNSSLSARVFRLTANLSESQSNIKRLESDLAMESSRRAEAEARIEAALQRAEAAERHAALLEAQTTSSTGQVDPDLSTSRNAVVACSSTPLQASPSKAVRTESKTGTSNGCDDAGMISFNLHVAAGHYIGGGEIQPEQLSPLGQFLLEQGLLHYLPAFEREDVTLNILPLLTDDDLAEIGVLSVGARLRILRHTKGLRPELSENDESDESF